jgi:hypothetical protein
VTASRRRFHSASQLPASPSRRRFLLAGAALSVVSLAGCGDDGPALPGYANTDPIRRAYRTAHANVALFEQLPCYCGCGASIGHQHLRHCFLDDDGGWHEHAAACSVCIEEALDAAFLLAEGATAARIRATIDATYTGLAAPTDTPPVTG